MCYDTDELTCFLNLLALPIFNLLQLILCRTLYIFISTIKEHDHCINMLTKLKDDARSINTAINRYILQIISNSFFLSFV